MTCIVGLVGNDGSLYVGGDSYVGDHNEGVRTGSHKVASFPKNITIGISGDSGPITALTHRFSPPARKTSVPKYISTTFMSAVRRTLAAYEKDMMAKLKYDSDMLIAIEGGIWLSYSDGTIYKSPPWGGTIGSGRIAAQGSLYTTHRLGITDPVRRTLLALEASAEVHPMVGPPFYVYKDGTLVVDIPT